MKKVLILLLTVFGLYGCPMPDVNPPPTPPKDSSKLELLWKSEDFKIDSGKTSNGLFRRPIIIGDYLVGHNIKFINSLWAYRDQSFIIYNRHTGEELKRLKPGFDKHVPNELTSYKHYFFSVFRSNGGLFCYDVDSKSLHWKVEAEEGVIYGTPIVHDKYVYFRQEYGFIADSVQMKRVDIETGAIEYLFTVNMEDFPGYWPHVNDPEIQVDENGDVIMYFVIVGIPFGDDSPINNYRGLLAYNITQRKQIWLTEVEKQVTFSTEAPVIFNDYVIVAGNKDIYSFNKYTGELVWKSEMPNMKFNGAMRARILLAYDKIFVKTDNKELYSFDPKDGSLLWELHKDCGNWVQSWMEYNDHVLYYASLSHRMYAIDMDTGKLLWKEKSPVKLGEFTDSGISLDKENNIVYASDRERILALKIKEE